MSTDQTKLTQNIKPGKGKNKGSQPLDSAWQYLGVVLRHTKGS
jgi:hypothetical protein